MLYVYRFLWPLRLEWLLVCCLYKEVYLQIFKRVSFWLHGCCGEWEGWARKPVDHNSWVAIVTPTDRPKSVRNRSVIELFCGVVCVVILPFWHFCWYRGFCHRTESDLFLFLLCGFISPFLLALVCFSTFMHHFPIFNYFLSLRITDQGSVPKMRIWSMVLTKSDSKLCIHLT